MKFPLFYNDSMNLRCTKIIKLSLWLLLLTLTGCAHVQNKDTQEIIQQAERSGFQAKILTTKYFRLSTWHRLTNPTEPLIVYLEGDGHSVHRRKPSMNPTPHQPLAFELAQLDSRSNIIYIARPCQFTPLDTDPKCDRKYWFTHKFSDEVINSTIEAIKHFRKLNTNSKIHLVGFSGGGGLAALIASRLNGVESLMTVAGDLDIQLMQAYHHTTPLWGSHNPITIAEAIKKIPQRHLIGSKDKIVPTDVTRHFIERQQSPCSKMIIFNNIGHHQGWKEIWPDVALYSEFS